MIVIVAVCLAIIQTNHYSGGDRMNAVQAEKKDSRFGRFLNAVERGGNKLPHPVTIFLWLSLIVIIVSEIVYRLGVPITYYDAKAEEQVTIFAVSLLNLDGLRYIVHSATNNFTSFAPLGTVLVAMLGVGVAEGSGLIDATLKKLVLGTPKSLITAVVVFAGIMSNIASDAGYIVLVPLGAVVFMSFGRHPLAGIAAAFAGVSAGFSANLVLGTTDPLLAGITNEALRAASIDYTMEATGNWWFMAVSTILLVILGWYVTEKIVEPRLGEYKGSHTVEAMTVSDAEKKGLKAAGLSLLLFTALFLVCIIPENAVFKVDGDLKQFLHDGLVPIIMLFFLIPGLVFGKVAGTIKSDKDAVKFASKAMASMGGYLVLAFVASQFVNYFNYTKLGTLLAVSGSKLLESIHFTGLPLIVAFIIVAAFINLFIGSASAKWAIMAPIFVPMMYNLHLTPELTQLAYRIGDSTTNIISPLMSYFALIVTVVEKYDEDTGLGTLISLMLPYSMIFLIGWTLLLIVWYFTGLPIGPHGAYMLM